MPHGNGRSSFERGDSFLLLNAFLRFRSTKIIFRLMHGVVAVVCTTPFRLLFSHITLTPSLVTLGADNVRRQGEHHDPGCDNLPIWCA
jgi:hypothetical protein